MSLRLCVAAKKSKLGEKNLPKEFGTKVEQKKSSATQKSFLFAVVKSRAKNLKKERRGSERNSRGNYAYTKEISRKKAFLCIHLFGPRTPDFHLVKEKKAAAVELCGERSDPTEGDFVTIS